MTQAVANMIREDSPTMVERGADSLSRTNRSLANERGPAGAHVLPASAFALRRTLRLKATLDFVLAVAITLVAVPVVLVCLILVWFTSRGPAIYSQRRVGQFGRVFTIYKIRTMYHNCESFTGPQWAKPGDPRVTPVGKVLRALHLDELPQLLNVLKGEMSLIGPRPERPEIAAKLTISIRDYDTRMVLKPGVSGFAQVHLPPDTCLTDVRNKLTLDKHYIRNISAWFDLKLMLWTGLKMVGMFKKAGVNAVA